MEKERAQSTLENAGTSIGIQTEAETEEESSNVWIIILVASIFVLIILVLLAAKFYLWHRKRLRLARIPKSRPIFKNDITPNLDVMKGALIGEGNFGFVYHGTTIISGNIKNIVIKEPKSENQYDSIMREIEIIKTIGSHTNILEFLGIVRVSEKMTQMVMEYCKYKDVASFFKGVVAKPGLGMSPRHSQILGNGNIEFDTRQLYIWCSQVASAMHHINSRAFIHRDLAPRNIFLTTDSDGEIISKLGDFGLAINLQHSSGIEYNSEASGQYHTTTIPLDTFQDKKFGKASDVWAFGVMVWEIFNLCRIDPFGHIALNGVALIAYLEKHKQKPLPQPVYANKKIYENIICKSMSNKKKVRERIVFQQLAEELENTSLILEVREITHFSWSIGGIQDRPRSEIYTGSETTACLDGYAKIDNI